MNTDKPDNPWKKRRQGRGFMPPSRALYAEKDGKKATATWVFKNGEWKCIAASGFLRWMRTQTINDHQGAHIEVQLEDDEVNWHWIEPNTVRVLTPPF